MDIAAAQRDMRQAHAWGATGVLASALAWGVAGLVAWFDSPQRAVWALFVGGALIHPVSTAMNKALGRGAHQAGNPLVSLALASTFWLIFCLPIAYVVSRADVAWFFPAMLLVIGGRYLVFSTVFGLRTYWALGLCLALAAYLLARYAVGPELAALAGSAIEFVFAACLFLMAAKAKPDPVLEQPAVP